MDNLIILALVVGIAAAFYISRRKGPERDDETPERDEEPVPERKLCDAELFCLAVLGDAEALRARLQSGLDATLRDVEWVSPLGAAIANGHPNAVRALLDAGVDPNGPAIGDQPALYVAASSKRASMLRTLIDAGAALDYSFPGVGSALSVAVIRRDRPTVDALLAAGVSTELRSEGGARALHYAALVGDRALTELLIAKGADLHRPNFQGGTPLRSAADAGHAEIVQLLLEKGADPSPVDSFDKRPIDYARENGHDEVVKILESAPRPPSVARDCVSEVPMALLLPPRNDATLQGVMNALEAGDTLTRSAASSLEAPSMVAAIRAVVPGCEILFNLKDQPDPRLPIRPVDIVLWSYDGTEARPSLPHPPEPIREAVARVAEYPYLLSSWSRAAERAAKKLRPEDLREVMAAMVHPPPGPSYFPAWDWYFRIEVAAALIASHLGDEAWEGSARRRALEDVLDGPADWSNTAAILVLLDVARRDEAARPLVVDALLRTARRAINPPAYQHAIQPAARALLEIPGVDAAVAGEMRELSREDD